MAGIEGAEFDESGIPDRLAPLGGGYAGDGSITPILPDGTTGTPIATNLGGVHAVVLSPGGIFGQNLYAASWSTGTLLRISAAGVVTTIASGLLLTNTTATSSTSHPMGTCSS